MISALFDRIADYKTPAWVIIGLLVGGWYLTSWQFATFLPRVEAAELAQQIDNITIEIRLRSAQDEVSRLESLEWTLERDPAVLIPNSAVAERLQEITQRKKMAERYHNCLVEKLDSGATREALERCEALNKR